MNYITIQPSGVLDNSNADKMHTSVNDAISKGADKILLDFQDVSFMNSFAIGTLVDSLKTAKNKGKSLFVCSLGPQMKMIFELTKLDNIFEVYKDRLVFEDAVMLS